VSGGLEEGISGIRVHLAAKGTRLQILPTSSGTREIRRWLFVPADCDADALNIRLLDASAEYRTRDCGGKKVSDLELTISR